MLRASTRLSGNCGHRRPGSPQSGGMSSGPSSGTRNRVAADRRYLLGNRKENAKNAKGRKRRKKIRGFVPQVDQRTVAQTKSNSFLVSFSTFAFFALSR